MQYHLLMCDKKKGENKTAPSGLLHEKIYNLSVCPFIFFVEHYISLGIHIYMVPVFVIF